MTNMRHFRAAAKLLGGCRDIPVNLWVAPPTKIDESELIKEGHYANLGAASARTEMLGCSLCMGNQAQVREGATVVSTSTRNFPNRLGKNANVFLASAELAAIASKLGHIPTVAKYHEAMGIVNKDIASIYKYLNFNQIDKNVENAKGVTA
jgi:aconitate hydratase 2/2-methylisocitrate dehydratase